MELKTEAQRHEWRERQRRSRATRAERENEARLAAMDPGERRVAEIMAQVALMPRKPPALPSQEELVRREQERQHEERAWKERSDKFDELNAECLLKTIAITRRTIWALTHNIPVGWATLYPEHFPRELQEK